MSMEERNILAKCQGAKFGQNERIVKGIFAICSFKKHKAGSSPLPSVKHHSMLTISVITEKIILKDGN